LAYHVCDWLVPTRDLLNDRGMMGDGIIELRKIRALVEAAGYAGPVEVEIFSDSWWARPADDVLDTCVARYRTVVWQALRTPPIALLWHLAAAAPAVDDRIGAA